MSRGTTKYLIEDTFASKSKEISNLEFVFNFEEFSKSKMCANVSKCMQESASEATLKSSNLHSVVVDGLSNAIGSLVEYKLHACTICPNEVDFNVYHAHQNQCSGGYTSGTLKFVEYLNPSLGAILKKYHYIQVSTMSISLILLCLKPCN